MTMLIRRTLEESARSLVEARRAAKPLARFPGAVPDTLEEAYALQLAMIALWPDAIAGWKVGRLSADLEQRYGVNRFVGPIFASDVIRADRDRITPFPVFASGSAAFEAELVVEVDRPGGEASTPAAGRLRVGVEIAASPVHDLPRLSTLATVADFGNNAGLILGDEAAAVLLAEPERLSVCTRIDDDEQRGGSAASLPGGPLSAFAFACRQTDYLGLPLTTGQFVSTGAVTGVWPVSPGSRCHAQFDAIGRLDCRVVARSPVREN